MKSGTKTPSRHPTSSIQKRIVKLSLGNCWEVKIQNNLAILNYVTSNYVIHKFQIFIDQSLSFSLSVYGWMLTEDHELYVMHNRSLLNVKLSNFIQRLENYVLCDGITTPDPNKECSFQKHVIPKIFNYSEYQQLQFKPRSHQDEYYRPITCKLILTGNPSEKNTCSPCCFLHQKFISERNHKVSVLNQPAKLNAPTSPERIKLTLQNQRLKCKQLQQELSKMRSALEKHGESVEHQLNEDFQKIFSGCDKNTIPNSMKLFWEEQQKYVQASCSSSVKYRPIVIRFCLNLAAKSSLAYSDLCYDCKTVNGILVLPSLVYGHSEIFKITSIPPDDSILL